MPLIIGEIEARIEVLGAGPAPAPKEGPLEGLAAAAAARAREIAERRFEEERRIEQRDPDRLGGS